MKMLKETKGTAILVFAGLLVVFLLGLTATALAVPPTTYDEADPAFGRSAWTYQDLQDATDKYEGSYAIFDDTSTAMYDNPHGGYDSTTNKCKVCHAVHRANGAYYLLRADSQDDACSYCHIGGSAHSAKVVYDLNPDGIYTMNGHTIGAQTQIPDSSIQQVAQTVTLSTTDANGDPLTDDIRVRSYDSTKNSMYRFTRHHSQSAAGTGRSGYKKVGPLALRCMNCHQPHNATNMIWRPRPFTPDFSDQATQAPAWTSGYKLLRLYPSATTTGAPNTYGMYDQTRAVKVIEDTATAGVNYSQNLSADGTYTENGVTRSRPLWIAQNMSYEYGGSGPSEDPATVNQATLSYWCADCHNLNVGSAEDLADAELGFKAHTERTHPAPFAGAHGGPGQCYSCHRNDLQVSGNTTDPAGYGSGQVGASMTGVISGASNSCAQCHYGTGMYYVDRMNAPTARESDFPHSGKATDIKLLGSYTAALAGSGSYVPAFYGAGSAQLPSGITEDNLDAVCLRCHPGVGVHN